MSKLTDEEVARINDHIVARWLAIIMLVLFLTCVLPWL